MAPSKQVHRLPSERGWGGHMFRPRKLGSPFRYVNASPAVIRLAVLLSVRLPQSLRTVENLCPGRGIDSRPLRSTKMMPRNIRGLLTRGLPWLLGRYGYSRSIGTMLTSNGSQRWTSLRQVDPMAGHRQSRANLQTYRARLVDVIKRVNDLAVGSRRIFPAVCVPPDPESDQRDWSSLVQAISGDRFCATRSCRTRSSSGFRLASREEGPFGSGCCLCSQGRSRASCHSLRIVTAARYETMTRGPYDGMGGLSAG